MLLAFLTLAVSSSQANVTGPNKSGIYKVDKYGAEFNAKKRKLRYDYENTEKYLQIKNEIAIL